MTDVTLTDRVAPRTEAGLRLVYGPNMRRSFLSDVLAIEAEARQQVVEQIRERLEGLSSSDLEHWADSILHSWNGTAGKAFADYVLEEAHRGD